MSATLASTQVGCHPGYVQRPDGRMIHPAITNGSYNGARKAVQVAS